MCELIRAVGLRKTGGHDLNWSEYGTYRLIGHFRLEGGGRVGWVSPERAAVFLSRDDVEEAGRVCACGISAYLERKKAEVTALAGPVRRAVIPAAADVTALSKAEAALKEEADLLSGPALWMTMADMPDLAARIAGLEEKVLA